MTDVSNARTLCRERDGLSSVCDGGDLMDAEPDSTAAVPSRDVAGSLGHVNVGRLQGQ